jgi:16S rRNA (guanine527-N7)-methyltransferase
LSEPSGPAFPFEDVIAARAKAAGIELAHASARALADHARLVLARNAVLNLTAITSPANFVERHLGEAFEGAALIPAAISGRLIDLGSGNGYPGIPLAHARPGLTPYLAESNGKKAGFLRAALDAAGLLHGQVLERSVQRGDDLDEVRPIAVLATRAMGGWERIVPKLSGCLGPEGRILVWAGENFAEVSRRASWSKLKTLAWRPLPGRDRASVVCLALK